MSSERPLTRLATPVGAAVPLSSPRQAEHDTPHISTGADDFTDDVDSDCEVVEAGDDAGVDVGALDVVFSPCVD